MLSKAEISKWAGGGERGDNLDAPTHCDLSNCFQVCFLRIEVDELEMILSM